MVVVVVMVVLMDVAASTMSMLDDSCFVWWTGINNAGVLDPLGDLAHCSAMVARPVMMPPIVMRQRHGFRLRSGNVSVTTGSGTAVFL